MYNKLVFHGFSDDEIYNILSKAKIGKWETAKPSYKERTKIKAHPFCDVAGEQPAPAEPAIKAEIEPGVFVISDYHDGKWYSSIVKDGEPAGQEVTSKHILWVTDEKRDRALRANMDVLDIGTRETRGKLLMTAISGILSTTRQQIIADWKAVAKVAEPQPEKDKTLEEKYPPEILEKANEMIHDVLTPSS